MKFNSREIAIAASLPNPDKEGKLAYKKPQKVSMVMFRPTVLMMMSMV